MQPHPLSELMRRLDAETVALRIDATVASGKQQTWLVELEDWEHSPLSLAELHELFNQPVVEGGESVYERVRSSLPPAHQHARIEIERRGLRLNWRPVSACRAHWCYWVGWLLCALVLLGTASLVAILLNTVARGQRV